MRQSKAIVGAVALLTSSYLAGQASAQVYTSEVILITGALENGSHSVNPPQDTPITHYDGGRVSSYLLDGKKRSDFSSLELGDQAHRAPIDIASADVDGDGTMEVAVLTGINRAPDTRENYIDSPQVQIRNADGSVRPNSVFGVSDFTGPIVPVAIAAGDVDFDGKHELIVLTGKNSSPGTNHNAVINPRVYIFKADGTPVPNTGFSIGAFGQELAPIAVAFDDVGGNSNPDVIVLTGFNTDIDSPDNYVTGASVRIFALDGTELVGTGFSVSSGGGGQNVGIDVAATDQAVGTRRIAVLTGSVDTDAGFDIFHTISGAFVGVYSANGTQSGATFNAASTLVNGIHLGRPGIRGMGLVSANFDFDTIDEFAVLLGQTVMPENHVFDSQQLPYIRSPQVIVTDTNGDQQSLWSPFPELNFEDEISTGIALRQYPCTNCNDGTECVLDLDRDGLKDVWETRGLDSDCDGDVDVDLPNLKGTGRGTDPMHKDVLVEVDYMQLGAQPTQAMVRAAKAMMRAAPNMVGNWPSPDGQPGVNLWLDTGTLRDPAGFEPSCPPGALRCAGPCDDNIDNDGDGQADELDSDCLANFGMEGVGACNDMIDNDGDGLIDALPPPMGPDPDCVGRAPNGPEGVGFCNDGLDNDNDGLTDVANDPDCAVGDNLGRGGERVSLSSLPQGGVPTVADPSFYHVKETYFDRSSRQPIFHYALFGVGADLTQGEAGPVTEGSGGDRSCEDFLDNDGNGLTDIFDPQCNTCLDGIDNDLDTLPDHLDPQCHSFAGGWAEVGGNDLVVYNTGAVFNPLATGPDPGTFMHELGHNFHLDHGGVVAGAPDSHNCKPQYVSIMNYQNQFGIIQAIPAVQFSDTDRDGVLDPFLIDYFPPRHQGGRSNFFPGGISITETALNESVVFDGTDPNSIFLFGARPLVPPAPPLAAAGVLTQFPVQGRDLNGDGINEIDWNGNGMLDPGTVGVDVDSASITDCASQTVISPTPLVAEDDWENMQLEFGVYPDASDGAHNPSQENGATTQELLEFRRISFRTDLAMTLQPPASVPPIGTSFNLDVVVRNQGPSRSVGLTAHIDLPEGTAFVSSSANCQEYFTGTLDCTLVDIYPGQVLAFPVTLRLTPASAGVPLLFAGQVSQPVASDSNPSNNTPETHINRPPACNAGGPYTLECGGATTQLTLNGAGSSDPDGDSLTYSWSGAFTPASASGVSPTVTVSGLGNKALSLSVSDGAAAQSCNSTATVKDTLPPTILANPVTVMRCLPTTDNVTVTASAADSCSGSAVLTGKLVFVGGKVLATPIALASNPVNIALPPGEARIEWRAVDASGNVKTVTQVVTVNVQETAAVCCAAGQTQVQGTAGIDVLLRPFSTPYCVFGLGANDNVITGTGKDFIAGGSGDDTIDSGLSNGDTLSGGIGNDWLNVPTGTATTLFGGDGNDIIEPNNAATIFGNAGDDYIEGLLGTHVIYPGPGRDTVHAGAGDDTIVIRNLCEVANLELLDGGLGNDTLITPVPVTELQARGVILLGINNVIIKTDEQHLSQCF